MYWAIIPYLGNIDYITCTSKYEIASFFKNILVMIKTFTCSGWYWILKFTVIIFLNKVNHGIM